MSLLSMIMSPRLIPMRNSMRRSAGTLGDLAPEDLQRGKCAFLIRAHRTRITGDVGRQDRREPVKRHAIGTPDRHGKGTPHWPSDRLVPVANRRVPRASRSALTSDGAARVGGACLPTGASRGGTQARFLKRQLSFPVSMISQWWVSRSRSAVVILASPNTLGHSPKVRLVVTIIEVRSYSRLIR